jgi:aminopeptidase N
VTDDLMAAVEQQAGTRLGWFFDQWLRRPGFARLTTDWHFGNTRVVVEIAQDDSRFAAYRFPLVVAVTDGTGTVHRVRVEVPARKTAVITLPLELTAAPRAVVFDPDVELLAEFRSK